MATKRKNEDVMDSISYAKDVLKSDGGALADMFIKIAGSKLGSRAGGGLTGASRGADALSRKLSKKKK